MRRLAIIFCFFIPACENISPESPVTPEEALSGFQLDPAFKIEVFAAEPYVRDPIAMVFDEHGQAFVAEMLDYPCDSTSRKSRIRALFDRNDDGRIDDAVVYADNISGITGLQPWKGGLIVTAAPDILFFRDTDGDHHADERRVLFSGFSLGNLQHRASTPTFAIDNWIYVTNDGQPGTIRLREQPGTKDSISVLGADFRFRMDQPYKIPFETASGPAQFGQAFDNYGNRFITHNTIHIRHVVLPRRYFERNPYLPARSTAKDISDHGLRVYQKSKPQSWRASRTEVRSRRYNELGLDRTEQLQGSFTGVSGNAIYGSNVFPGPYWGNMFLGEVTANVIHRDVLKPDGPTFMAGRSSREKETEFLASKDPWFRPCSITNGPDGFLYIVDMYREIIESPEYIPEYVRAQLDFYRGTEYGRIYRIRPKGTTPQPVPSFNTRPEYIVQALEHPNKWTRLTAQRLLIEKQDPGTVPMVREIALHGATSQGRLHALYVLESMNSLDKRSIEKVLKDPIPGIREHALRMAESFPELTMNIIQMAEDPDPRVRLQAALSIGTYNTPEAIKALTSLAARHGGNPWFTTAILSASPDIALELLERLLQVPGDSETPNKLIHELAVVVGARKNHQEIIRLIELLASSPQREGGLSGLAAGLKLAGARNLNVPAARQLLSQMTQESEAAKEAADYFLVPENIAEYPPGPPETSAETVHILASRQSWLGNILSGLQEDNIQPQALDADTRLRLLENPAGTIRDRASKLMAKSSEVDAEPVLNLTGNSDRGRTLFNRECALCHGPGINIGPDLNGVSNKSREQLLEAIVDPSRAIPGTYTSYVAELDDGSLVAGRIVAEMPGTLKFRSLRGDQTILRSRIKRIRQSERSLMPEDYGTQLNYQELADIIAYLKAINLME